MGQGQLLNFATQDVAVNGEVFITEDLGTQGNRLPATLSAFATEDGKTFWVYAPTPNNYTRAVECIGSRAESTIEHTFRKDDPVAALNYTFLGTLLAAYVNPEFGPGCRRGEPLDCLQSLLVSAVDLRDSSNHVVWHDNNAADLVSRFGASPFEVMLEGN